jgi:hypothetical protein
VVDLDAAIEQHELQITVADGKHQIPSHGPKDHLGCELAPLEATYPDLITEHWRPYTSDGAAAVARRRTPDRRKRREGAPPLSSDRQTPSSLGVTNSILLDAGGLVGVLVGLCDVARFLCCFPFVGPVDRGDKSDMGEAITRTAPGRSIVSSI